MLLLRAAVSLSYFLPFIGGIAIVIRIFLSSSLHASFADFVKPHATFISYQLLMNNFCIDRCVWTLLHLMSLNLPQWWPDLSNTGVCFNNPV